MDSSRFLSLIVCALALLAGCAAEGSELDGPASFSGAGDEPVEVGSECRTEDDCSAGERCVAVDGRSFACITASASALAAPRGPQGQPPPPTGLIEGAPRFGAPVEGGQR